MGSAYPLTDRRLGDDGFVSDPQRWSADLASRMAKEDGIGELSDAHWHIIKYLRHNYLHMQNVPPARNACHTLHLAPHCVDELFHGMREAWRVAGLPDPGEEARTYMD